MGLFAAPEGISAPLTSVSGRGRPSRRFSRARRFRPLCTKRSRAYILPHAALRAELFALPRLSVINYTC